MLLKFISLEPTVESLVCSTTIAAICPRQKRLLVKEGNKINEGNVKIHLPLLNLEHTLYL